MSAALSTDAVPHAVARKISKLRTLVRLYVLMEGLAALAIVFGVAFWAALGLDWLLEPSHKTRIAMWALIALAALWTGWKYLGRRLFAPLRDESLALVIERKYPRLQESVVTSIKPAGGHDHPFYRELLASSGRRAAAAMPGVSLRSIFAPQPLGWKAFAAMLLAASIVVLAMAAPETFAIWKQRMALSPVLWPRRVQLSAPAFGDRNRPRIVNVARDEAFHLTVLASTVPPHEAPQEVEVRWRSELDGARGNPLMTRVGTGADGAQEFALDLKASADIVFDVIGGDDRIRNLRLRAVERPAITSIWLDCKYPPYLHREDRTLAVGGQIEIPEMTSTVCRMVANKSLASVLVIDAESQEKIPVELEEKTSNKFSFSLPAATADRVLLVTLNDRDGVDNREPHRLVISAVADLPPEIDVQLRNIGSAVTPQALINFRGRISDDYALERAWFEYRIDGGEPQRRPLKTQPTGLQQFPMTEPLDLSEVDPETRRPKIVLTPGQKLVVGVRADDAYDLSKEPRVGTGPTFLLDVVTPSQLRAILEKRELALRQRFEAIHERMTSVSDLLDRVAANAESGVSDSTADNAQSSGEANSASDRNRLRVAGASQSAAQLAAETTGVAEGFDDIVGELISNRIDTEELKSRLEQGISEPLKTIGGEMLPALEKELGELQVKLGGTADLASRLSKSRNDAREIVEAMQAVLDRMLELESYNELVEMLRGIVEEQKQLQERTKAEQREKLRGLLDE